MKWLISLVLVLVMVTPAMAGEDPYISVVGIDSAANFWYVSPKHQQFMFDETSFGVPVCWGSYPAAYNVPYHPIYGAGCEQFRAQNPVNQPEICDTQGTILGPIVLGGGLFDDRGNDNAVVKASNAGWFEWYIRLAKKPSGEINLVLQCGVLKPNAFAIHQYGAVELCAAETGERVGPNCTRIEVDPGTNPLIIAGLPKITAQAIAGPSNNFTTFNLTAFRNPGTYNPFPVTAGIAVTYDAMVNNGAAQVLDGSNSTRILLKTCMDKTIVTKLPVTGQVNALGQLETDLEAGDLIYVRIDIPRQNTVDVYCHEQSLKLAGVGESPF
jgi:hypothetical protein